MASRIITYDLSTPVNEYPELENAIKQLGQSWRCMNSTWIVDSSESPSVIRDALSPLMGGQDKLMVIELTGEMSGLHLDDECNKQLKVRAKK